MKLADSFKKRKREKKLSKCVQTMGLHQIVKKEISCLASCKVFLDSSIIAMHKYLKRKLTGAFLDELSEKSKVAKLQR